MCVCDVVECDVCVEVCVDGGVGDVVECVCVDGG